MTRRDVWVRMLLYPRHTLPTAIAPVLVASGLAWSEGVFALLPALAAFLAGWLVQLGGVFTDNDTNLRRYPDDAEHAAFVTALRGGTITLGELRRAILGCYAGAVAVGLYLVWLGGLPALAIGLIAIAASLLYSVGPFPLGDRALGDPLFFVCFGLLAVAGSYYVQAVATLWAPLPLALPEGTLTPEALLAGVPVAALTTNILIIDNIRDRDYDLAKGEITLAVVLGRRGSVAEYIVMLALAYLVPIAAYSSGRFGLPVLLPLLTLPYAALVLWRVARTRNREAMIPLTPQAGQLLLAFSALFALGMAW